MPAPTLRNQAILFTIYAPSILAMSLLLAATMSGQTWVGLIYIFGLFILNCAVWPLVSSLFSNWSDFKTPDNAKVALCSILFHMPLVNNAYAAPAFYMTIYAYTFLYVLYSSFVSGTTLKGNQLIFVLSMVGLMAFTIYVRYCLLKCLPQGIGPAIIAIMVGLILGGLWGLAFAIIAHKMTGNSWFFASTANIKSSRLKCDKPESDKDMVCTIGTSS